MLIAVDDSFDIQYDGKLFGFLWEQEKSKSAFTWSNKDKKHNPYEAKDFGGNLEAVNKATSREVGFSRSLEMQESFNENEEKKEQTDEIDGLEGLTEEEKAEIRKQAEIEKKRMKNYDLQAEKEREREKEK